MEPDVNFLQKSDLSHFIRFLRIGIAYGTIIHDRHCIYEKISDESVGRIVLEVPPPVESIKGFMFPAKERVAVYPSSGEEEPASTKQQAEQTIIGVRACDLRALEVLDQIFLKQEVKDPFYEKRRQNTFLVTTDCVEPKETCFCNLVGGNPYAEQGYDLNISPLEKGYLVTVGSEKGGEVIKRCKKLLTQASPEQLEQRDRRRKAAQEKLKTFNAKFVSLTDPAKMFCNQPPEKWDRLTSTCVECGACNFICPTCHCFFLYDQPVAGSSTQNERQKTWDSCILGNFAKMAGVGGMKPTPRPELRSRLENRIRHKFEWMPENIKMLGCVGCGRCFEACLDGSDIREVITAILG